MSRPSWDDYYMGLCVEIAKRSKDRSTQVGALLRGPDNEIRTTAYNGFPRGVNDDVESRHERPAKYLYTEHAERNIFYNCARVGIPSKGCTLYVTSIPEPLPICAECARAIIQSGVIEVVVGSVTPPERWRDSVMAALEMLEEAGVKIKIYNGELNENRDDTSQG